MHVLTTVCTMYISISVSISLQSCEGRRETVTLGTLTLPLTSTALICGAPIARGRRTDEQELLGRAGHVWLAN